MNGEWTFATVSACQRFVCAAVMGGTVGDGPRCAAVLQAALPDPPSELASQFLLATLMQLAIRWGYEHHRRMDIWCPAQPCAPVTLADAAMHWPTGAGRHRAVDLFVAHITAIREDLETTHRGPLAHRAASLIKGDASVSFETIARTLGAHPSTLRRAFQREFGMTAREYLSRLRVQRAEALLLGDRTAKVEPIALEAGWSTKTGLYRAFRQFRGSTPRAPAC